MLMSSATAGACRGKVDHGQRFAEISGGHIDVSQVVKHPLSNCRRVTAARCQFKI